MSESQVSTQEQKTHGLSVDSQIVALEKYCDDNNLEVAGIYNDAGISARKKYTGRPALLQLLKDCERGKIDIILFTRLDRWFRSVADYYQVQAILEKTKVPWKTIWEDYSTEDSSGVFKVNIMLSIAQAEADRTSEKIKSVNEYRREKGDYIGTEPFGYMRKNRRLVKKPEEQACTEAIFETYLATFSSKKCMDRAKDFGFDISRRHLKSILRNPTYTGNAFGSICEPYITQEQHDLIVTVRMSRMREPLDPNVVFIFSGICKCGICGGCVAAKNQRYQRKHDRGSCKIYRCARKVHEYNCPGTQISERNLEKYLIENLDEIISQYNYSATLKAKDTKDIPKKIAKIDERLKRVGDRYEEGDISRNAYRAKRDELLTEKKKLQLVLNEASASVSLPEDWKDIYNELSPQGKKTFWRKILSKVVLYREKDPDVYFN